MFFNHTMKNIFTILDETQILFLCDGVLNFTNDKICNVAFLIYLQNTHTNMKYKSLRGFMNKKNLSRPYTYKNKSLVIDGLCFKEMYMKSHCQSIFGGEYDRFASYLKQVLASYIKSNISCYIVFNGAMHADLNKRKEIQQNIIDRVDSFEPDKKNVYCEPVFVKDVYKDVLTELGIKYYVCVYDSKHVLFNLARKLRCPILTNNIEYVLYGIPVIPFKSVVYNKANNHVNCLIYHVTLWRRCYLLSDDITSALLTMSDEDSGFYNELLNTFRCRSYSFIPTILYWIRRQSMESVNRFMKSHLKPESQEVFKNTITELRNLFVVAPNLPAVDFLTKTLYVITDNNRFEHAVGTGSVAIQFINLKNYGILSGSWLVCDKNRDDAMLPAVDIAFHALGILTNSLEVEITFVGSEHGKSYTAVIKKILKIQSNTKEAKTNTHKNNLNSSDQFKNFVIEQLPGFHMNMLEAVPEDCWILLISMLYYSVKAEGQLRAEVYCIILSYVLLGPVSENVGLIKRCNFSVTHGIAEGENSEVNGEVNNKSNNSLTAEQCAQAANAVIDLFYVPEHGLNQIFDRNTLHTFTEFQHCLQFMNYLNRLCGGKIKCTAYHKTINCTFIYNLYVLIKAQSSPDDYIENLLNCPSVYSFFKNILLTYFDCLSSLKIDNE